MDPDLRAELKAEVDEVWAEILRHLPLVQGQQDPARAPVLFEAILRTGDRAVESMNFGRGNTGRAGITADGGYLRIDRALNPDLLICKGDKVVALARDGEPVFEVQAVDDRSHLRLICELGDAN
ncbi:hypothetical protein DL1_03285 [Thioclava dalianensis]|uniref:Uncharacterized protein n=1 Tax=Thioclava dalianensis TaxID=1185766 RepID=A0A074U4Q2_9RHOB|nr:hypothetical protein [Thioclava dalianensis]KEP69627.1 hypothetical protein DL1_03285 [Thioclava dalianensis]SFN16105.1 hypothetical protein SAMN05216224_102719 [Thioclava dalianensis]